MSDYKIKVRSTSNGYKASLFKRFLFFFWYRVRAWITSEVPISKVVISWQKEFSIPDKKVCITI